MIISVSLVSNALTLSMFMFPEQIFTAQNDQKTDPLVEVHRSREIITGITTTTDGRIFLEYPRLDGSSGISVAELHADGTTHAYLDRSWNIGLRDKIRRAPL
jgi:hypothetical protein